MSVSPLSAEPAGSTWPPTYCSDLAPCIYGVKPYPPPQLPLSEAEIRAKALWSSAPGVKCWSEDRRPPDDNGGETFYIINELLAKEALERRAVTQKSDTPPKKYNLRSRTTTQRSTSQLTEPKKARVGKSIKAKKPARNQRQHGQIEEVLNSAKFKIAASTRKTAKATMQTHSMKAPNVPNATKIPEAVRISTTAEETEATKSTNATNSTKAATKLRTRRTTKDAKKASAVEDARVAKKTPVAKNAKKTILVKDAKVAKSQPSTKRAARTKRRSG